MRWLWIVGMVVSGLGVLVFSEPSMTAMLAVMTFGLVLPVAPILMNLWMLLVLLVPVLVLHARGRLVPGIVIAAALGLGAVTLDATLIDRDQARLIPVQGPELAALAVPPRSIDIVTGSWSDLGARSRTERYTCGEACAALLTTGTVEWLRIRLEDRGKGPPQSYRIAAEPVAECMARLPGYDLAAPCLMFRPDDGAPADLMVRTSVIPQAMSTSRVRIRHALRTVVTDTRTGGGVVHDRTDGTWDVAVSPPAIVPNVSFSGGPWEVRRWSERLSQTAPTALEVLARATEGTTSGGQGPDDDGRAAHWLAALVASAHDLGAGGHDPEGQLRWDFLAWVRSDGSDRPPAPHEVLLRWQLATSDATRDVVRAHVLQGDPPTLLVPDIALLFDALESPGFGSRVDAAAAIATEVLAAPPGTYAALSARFLAAMASDDAVRGALLPVADRLGHGGG